MEIEDFDTLNAISDDLEKMENHYINIDNNDKAYEIYQAVSAARYHIKNILDKVTSD